jgi:2-C-methyl-D-erythritol 4-phosphate cytidylyltransferase
MYVAAIVPAAGKGRRMGMGRNKAFLPLQRKPVLVHTLSVLSACSVVDEIIVAVSETDLCLCNETLLSQAGVTKSCKFVAGGPTRQESVRRCLPAASPKAELFIVHDAVRPLVTPSMVESVTSLAARTGAAVCAVPAKDTVRISTDGTFFSCTPERSTVWLVQTPQVFAAEALRAAHDFAVQTEYLGTDDASLVERLGMRVYIADGSYENLKITTREDLVLADAILKHRKGEKRHAGTRDDDCEPGDH